MFIANSARLAQTDNARPWNSVSSDTSGSAWQPDHHGYESCLSNPQHNKYEKMNSDGTNERDATGLVSSKSKLPDLNQTKYDKDPFSSDESEWSSQFGEVVPGHFFR